jgi:hypothetical protein
MATSLNELPGRDLMRLNIDTGNSLPMRKRAYRHTPTDKDEINRETREMPDARSIEQSDTSWCSTVLLVTKKGGLEEFWWPIVV